MDAFDCEGPAKTGRVYGRLQYLYLKIKDGSFKGITGKEIADFIEFQGGDVIRSNLMRDLKNDVNVFAIQGKTGKLGNQVRLKPGGLEEICRWLKGELSDKD